MEAAACRRSLEKFPRKPSGNPGLTHSLSLENIKTPSIFLMFQEVEKGCIGKKWVNPRYSLQVFQPKIFREKLRNKELSRIKVRSKII